MEMGFYCTERQKDETMKLEDATDDDIYNKTTTDEGKSKISVQYFADSSG